MEKLIKAGSRSQQLTREEAIAVVGGNDFVKYMKCVTATLTTGGGGLRTLVLGHTLFGMARFMGVLVGCSSL